jgi:hypothetical protein
VKKKANIGERQEGRGKQKEATEGNNGGGKWKEKDD